jgi:hypothetical protein
MNGPQRAQKEENKLLFCVSFVPFCGSNLLKFEIQVQYEKQSYSECHGPKTPDNQNSESTV